MIFPVPNFRGPLPQVPARGEADSAFKMGPSNRGGSRVREKQRIRVKIEDSQQPLSFNGDLIFYDDFWCRFWWEDAFFLGMRDPPPTVYWHFPSFHLHPPLKINVEHNNGGLVNGWFVGSMLIVQGVHAVTGIYGRDPWKNHPRPGLMEIGTLCWNKQLCTGSGDHLLRLQVLFHFFLAS